MKTYLRHYLLIFIASFMFVVACDAPPASVPSTATTPSEAYPPSDGYPDATGLSRITANDVVENEVVAPAADRATITGVVFSERTDKPMVAVPVRLAEVYYEGERGAFVLDGAQSPGATTDNNGRFVFVDMEPKDYVIVIGNAETNDYTIVPDEAGNARIWTAVAGEILDTQTLRALLESWE